jgi:alkylresorcinol/alkylpyrone synthase
MSRLISIGTSIPANKVMQSDAKEFARMMYGEVYHGDIERIVAIYDHTQIDSRYFCVPKEWFRESHTFEEKNNLYVEHAIQLSTAAIHDCLAKASVGIEDIDYLIFVSTTGLATPSIDARLIHLLPFKKNIRRLPLWGLGCAGGAASLSLAMNLANAEPTATILVVVAELCGLTFVKNDMSKAALISTALFSDGAAAALICGDKSPATVAPNFPRLIASETRTMDESLNVMGWNFSEHGFRVILSQHVPEIVKTFLKESVDKFFEKKELKDVTLSHFITHPGGAKVLQAYQETFGLTAEQLQYAYDILRDYGNMSACTVLFILEKFIQNFNRRGAEQEYGLLAALGPGFSSELVLLKWE